MAAHSWPSSGSLIVVNPSMLLLLASSRKTAPANAKYPRKLGWWVSWIISSPRSPFGECSRSSRGPSIKIARMAVCHLGTRCTKRRGAPDRQPVLVKGGQITLGGLSEPALPFPQLGQAEVRFREAGVPGNNRLISGGGRVGIARWLAAPPRTRRSGVAAQPWKPKKVKSIGSVQSEPRWPAERSRSVEHRSGHSMTRSLPTACGSRPRPGATPIGYRPVDQ